MEEEVTQFQQTRESRVKQLLSSQDRLLREFDLKTTTMGLDAMHIAEVTQENFAQDVADDNLSIRGSSLSLTSSASASSSYLSSTSGALSSNSSLFQQPRNNHQLPPHNTAL